MILDDSNLSVGQRIKCVGASILILPILTSGYITEKSLLVSGICISPVVGTMEYIATGKIDETKNGLNAIGNINRMVANNLNNFLEIDYQLKYRDTFD